MPGLFIGIKINNAKNIVDLQKNLKISLSKSIINWVEPANFHLTLKFLGEVESHFITPINQILEHLSKGFKQFILQPDGLGIFGTIQKPHIIWYGFKENPLLSSMQASIEKSLSDIGFDTGDKSFSPHVTIARVKTLFEKDELYKSLQLINENSHYYEISDFQLIQSNLNKEGPVYKIIKSFELMR